MDGDPKGPITVSAECVGVPLDIVHLDISHLDIVRLAIHILRATGLICNLTCSCVRLQALSGYTSVGVNG